MKCLSRVEMQEYADREITPGDEAAITEHLSGCESCKEMLRQVEEDKILINNVLGQVGIKDDETAIPVFNPPLINRKKILIRMIAVAAAAIVTGLIFLVRPERRNITGPVPEAEILLYEFYEGKDLNKMWHEKSQIIILQDEKGNVIQSIITH